MENELMLDEKNIMVMKLLHYFITEKNYNPIVLQGVDNEIWLENLDEDCKVIRIVSEYIHNDEQYAFDVFKTKRIMSKIKKKTFSFSLNVMSFFLDMGDNVTELNSSDKIMQIKVKDEKDIKNSEYVKKVFPDLPKKMDYSEDGLELLSRITGDIHKHNREDAKKIENVFKSKVPYVTYLLMAINVIFYLVPLLLGEYDYALDAYCVHGPSIRAGQYYRIITGTLLHGGLMHLIFNNYSLYVLGSQLEGFFGKFKFALIYIFSAICGSLLSITFSQGAGSVGASGAIFGLMGSLLYFGFYYRVYLGQVVKSQILPLVILNLVLGFIIPGIDNFAHIGGLVGGAAMTMAIGVKDKSSTFEKVNGWVIALAVLAFFAYMGLVVAG